MEVPNGSKPPESKDLFCTECGIVPHSRTVSLPAPYTGEHIRNPEIYGGQCDTMGFKKLRDLPDLPGAGEHSARKEKALREHPDNASAADRREVLRQAGKTAPSGADYASLFSTNEYRDASRERAHISRQNKAKRERAKAHKAGANINFRRDRCEGDPKI